MTKDSPAKENTAANDARSNWRNTEIFSLMVLLIVSQIFNHEENHQQLLLTLFPVMVMFLGTEMRHQTEDQHEQRNERLPKRTRVESSAS